MKQLILATLMLVLTGPAFAGREGNGAGGYEYLNANGEKEYQLLDLYEAKIPGLVHPNGLKIVETDEDYHAQALKAIYRLKQAGWHLMAEHVENMLKALVTSNKDVPFDPDRPGQRLELAFPEDAYNLFAAPKNYRPVGLANWNDDLEVIYLDHEKDKAMKSETSRAALRLHEAVYKALRLRDPKLEDSRMARFIVGYLFSDMKPADYPFANRLLALNADYARYDMDSDTHDYVPDYIIPYDYRSVFQEPVKVRIQKIKPEAYCPVAKAKVGGSSHYLQWDSPDMREIQLGDWVDVNVSSESTIYDKLLLTAYVKSDYCDYKVEFQFGGGLILPAHIYHTTCGEGCEYQAKLIVYASYNDMYVLRELRNLLLSGYAKPENNWGLYIPGTDYQGLR